MSERSGLRLLAVSASLLYAAAAISLHTFTADDAYIVARYAENLVDFGALEFNLGERIQAFTSPLHVLFEAGLHALTGATVPAYKWASLLLALAAVAVLLRELAGDVFASSMTLLVVLLSPSVVLWTFGGLETPLLMCLATLLAVLAVRDGSLGQGRLHAIFLVAGLCFLTRYDSVLFAGPLVVYAAARTGWSGRRLAPAALVGALLPVAWLSFSWLYFGDVLPTSYHVKMPGVDTVEILRNASYLGQYFTVTGLVPLLLWTLGECRPRSRFAAAAAAHFRRTWGLWVGLFAMVAYGLWVATAHMFFGFRYFVPYLPAAVLLLGGLHRQGVAGRAESGGRPAKGFMVLALGLLLFQGYQIFHTYHRSMNGVVTVAEYLKTGTKQYEQGMMAARIEVAGEIRRHWTALGRNRPPRIFTTAGGVLPYTYRQAYILERLVSYRERCEYSRAELARFADYVHILSPRHGSVGSGLPKRLDLYEQVGSRFLIYDGILETSLILFDPRPTQNPLPSRVDDACGG